MEPLIYIILSIKPVFSHMDWITVFGNGYSQRAKSAFFVELFLEHGIETVFMKIRKQNIRSRKAVQKLPYVKLANDVYPDVYQRINMNEQMYDLYYVERSAFFENSMDLHQVVAT